MTATVRSDTLRAHRRVRNLTLPVAASLIGVSTSTVRHWEAGRVVPEPAKAAAYLAALAAYDEAKRDQIAEVTSGLVGGELPPGIVMTDRLLVVKRPSAVSAVPWETFCSMVRSIAATTIGTRVSD